LGHGINGYEAYIFKGKIFLNDKKVATLGTRGSRLVWISEPLVDKEFTAIEVFEKLSFPLKQVLFGKPIEELESVV
jgi:hypothetical protein